MKRKKNALEKEVVETPINKKPKSKSKRNEIVRVNVGKQDINTLVSQENESQSKIQNTKKRGRKNNINTVAVEPPSEAIFSEETPDTSKKKKKNKSDINQNGDISENPGSSESTNNYETSEQLEKKSEVKGKIKPVNSKLKESKAEETESAEKKRRKTTKKTIDKEHTHSEMDEKRPKKKVRIDETESLKVKKELADTESHFSAKELPAKIIKSKLNKNLTEEVKVSPLTVQSIRKEKKTLKKMRGEKVHTKDIENDDVLFPGKELNVPNHRVNQNVNCVETKSQTSETYEEINGDTSNSDDSDLEVYYINKNAQIEAKKKDKLPSPKKHSISMPKEDQLTLVQRIQEVIPENDTKSYNYRLQKLEWENVAFKSYSIEECQKVWNQLFKKVRHYRLLAEVTHDIKTIIEVNDLQELNLKPSKSSKKHPDMPKRPLSSYFLFYLRERDKIMKEMPDNDKIELNKFISEKYQNLPLEKKQKYEMLSAKNREEYKRQMQEFYEKHPEMRKVVIKKPKPEKKDKPPKRPDNPYHLFMQSELKREEISEEDKAEFKEVCREKWRQMSDAKKLIWIKLAEEHMDKYEEEIKKYMALHPEYTPKTQTKRFLSREEINLKDKLAGKPKKPPSTAYGLFISITVQSDETANIPSRERWNYTAAKWKAMSEDERDQYKQMLIQCQEQYEKDYKAYLESLPEDKRREEILKNMPKKRKGSTTTVKPSTGSTKIKKIATKTKASRKKGVTSTQKLETPIVPPRSAYKYFAEKYSGENPKKAWEDLSSDEKSKYKSELSALKDKYIKEFEAFLKSLSEEELAAFCAKRKEQVKYSSSDETDSESEQDEEDSSEHSGDSSLSENEFDEN